MRLLHLADLHLDAAFQSRSRAVRERLRDAARTAFASAVDEAARRRVDAVLIAGDLFDGERLSIQTERFLGERLATLAQQGIRVVYATGNHDPGGVSGHAQRVAWPEGVTVVAEPAAVRLEITRDGEPHGYVTAAGHSKARVTDDLSTGFPAPEGQLPEVALLHTQVRGSRDEGSHEPYAPSELAYLSRAGFDYWALGHVHTRQALSEVPGIYYPGNTQGRNHREEGARGGLIVSLGAGHAPQVDFLPLGPVRWETLKVTGLEDEPELTGVARHIEAAWEVARQEDPGAEGTGWILRIDLEGPSPLHRDWKDPQSISELVDVLGPSLGLIDLEIRTHKLRPVLRGEDYSDRVDVLGEALRMLREIREDGDAESAARMLGLVREDLLGLGTDEGRDVDEYIRSLLQDGDSALLEALVEVDPSR